MSPPARPALVAVVVTYDNAEDIAGCLRALVGQLPDDGSKVVVFDNCSRDETAALVEQRFPEVELIRSEANLGFARACNAAARTLDTSFVLLVNPDTAAQPGCIRALLEVASRRPEAGLYGGRSIGPDGRLDPRSCWGRTSLWSLFCFATGLSSLMAGSEWFNPEGLGAWTREEERQVDIISGSLLMARRDLWDELGGFDERFFMYGEDADLGMRAGRLGRRPVFTPEAVYVHAVGRSSSEVDKAILLFRGKSTLVRKRWSGPSRRAAMGLLALGVALRAAGASASDSLLNRRHEDRRRIDPSTWSALWSRRGEWRAGWPAVPS
jgi:GT2 family glycosyltransferase